MLPDCLKGQVVCGTVYGDMHYKYPGINRKSRVLYPSCGFVSSAPWPSLPKKQYNGLIIINHKKHDSFLFIE